MPVKFLLDRSLLEQQQIIEQIMNKVKKKPYPNPETRHLATFLHALFQTGKTFEIEKPKKEEPDVTEKKVLPEKRPIEKEFKPVKEKLKPLPPPPLPSNINPTTIKPERPAKEDIIKEYVVNNFNTPIGILLITKNNKPYYHVFEPKINQNMFKALKDTIQSDFLKQHNIIDNREYLNKKLNKLAKKFRTTINPIDVKKYQYHLKRDLLGFRRIDPMMQDTKVKSIQVNGINKPIEIKHEQFEEKIKSNVIFTDPKDLNILLIRLAKATDNEISEKKPILDTIAHGFKIHGIMGIGDTSSKLAIKKIMNEE